MICDKLDSYHILTFVRSHAMNWAIATQSSYLDILNYCITCQRVHWLVTWCLPDWSGAVWRFWGYSIASGPVVGCLKMTRKEGLQIEGLKFVWFGAVVSFLVCLLLEPCSWSLLWILKCCNAFKCLSCQGSIGFTVFQMPHHDFISLMSSITLTFSEFGLAMFHFIHLSLLPQGTYLGGTPPGATCRHHCNLLLKAAILPSRSSIGAEGALSPWKSNRSTCCTFIGSAKSHMLVAQQNYEDPSIVI